MSRAVPIAWQYAYDRNALLSSTAVGTYRVAIAQAGHLLVFDRDHRLVGELLMLGADTAAAAMESVTHELP